MPVMGDKVDPPKATPLPRPERFRLRFNFRTIVILILLLLAVDIWWTGYTAIPSRVKSLMEDPMTAEPSDAQKARLQEVADGLLTIYNTLADLCYLDPAGIERGPHILSSELESVYEKHNLSPSIKYLYSIMPYVDEDKSGQRDFFQQCEFTDFRDPEEFEQGRDPFYADPEGDDFNAENGPYIRPWVTPLCRLGNHGTVILYDARSHMIWMIDQEGWGTSDPAFEHSEYVDSTRLNDMAFDHMPNRPATDVLRDLNKWYRTLKVVPGGGENAGMEWGEGDINLRALYKKNGWPDKFDREGFKRDQVQAYKEKYGSDP